MYGVEGRNTHMESGVRVYQDLMEKDVMILSIEYEYCSMGI